VILADFAGVGPEQVAHLSFVTSVAQTEERIKT
jgi:hypothetical protein